MRLIEIKEALDLDCDNPVQNHACLLFAEARDSKRWAELKTASHHQERLREVRESAVKYLQQPLKALPYSLFKLFRETGSRKEYEAEYFEHRDRLNSFAILALTDGHPQYLHALEDAIWAICEEYTWCLPAHLDDSPGLVDNRQSFFSEQGILKEKSRDQERMLDLFAAETAFALAEILSLLEEKLAWPVVGRGRMEIFRRVLEPYIELNPMLWWETSTMNWAAVCAGSIGAAAMYLIDNDAVLAPLLKRVLETMDCFLDGFGADGACTEGIGYWAYGFGFYTYFTALLKQRTAGRIDLFQNEKVKQIALFQQKCYLTENDVVSFSDAALTGNYLPGLAHYLKSVFEEVRLPDGQFQAKLSDDRVPRWAHAVRNLIWYNPHHVQGLMLETAYYLPDAEWFISRQKLGHNIICFAVKGGHNDEPHNHNDIGSFILHGNGDNLLADLGRSQYTRQYFGAERYEYLCPSSRGHSVPIVEGAYQKPGREYRARMMEVQTAVDQDVVLMDIAKAYGEPNLESLLRKFVFEKTGDARLILNDEYTFEQVPASLTERLVTFFQPQESGESVIRVAGVNSSMDILFNPQVFTPVIRQASYITQESETKGVYLIDLVMTPITPKISAELIFLFK